MRCPKMGLKIGNVLAASLLALLLKKPAHGYSLVEELEEFGLDTKTVPYAVVYRLLRNMEEDGLIDSQWDVSGNGPSKRVYHITDKGKEYLQMWVLRAKKNLRVMEKMLLEVENILDSKEGGKEK